MFRRTPKPSNQIPEWLIVGLGNPGPEYKGTKHNLGFEVIDLFSDQEGIKLSQSKHQARFGIGEVAAHPIALVKPLTYMNLSGRSVAPLARQFGIKPDHVLVISDDTDLAPGRIRLKPQGSAGGHNGHKSIIESLGTTEYPRLKLGIGRVSKDSTIGHVLGGFPPEEKELVRDAVKRAAKVIVTLVTLGLELALNEANN